MQRRRPAAREKSLLAVVVRWFAVGAVEGARPGVYALHFYFEKVFRKMIVYCCLAVGAAWPCGFLALPHTQGT